MKWHQSREPVLCIPQVGAAPGPARNEVNGLSGSGQGTVREGSTLISNGTIRSQKNGIHVNSAASTSGSIGLAVKNFEVLFREPDEALRKAWEAWIARCPYASLSTSPEFFLEPKAKDVEVFAVLALDRSEVIGVATGNIDGPFIQCGSECSPQVCVEPGPREDPAYRHLGDGLRDLSATRRGLLSAYAWSSNLGMSARGFRVTELKMPLGAMILDLSSGERGVFEQFSASYRTKIRKAERAGVRVEEFDVNRHFDDYYSLYKDWCSFKSLPLVPPERQRAALALRENRAAFAAFHEGVMIGVSTFRYCRAGLIEYAANVSRREESAFGQNSLLMWAGIRWAIRQGCFRQFSMAGAHYFLQRFGGVHHPTFRYQRDTTFLRHHYLRQGVSSAIRAAYSRLPQKLQRIVRRGSVRPAGNS
jgi:hypothetical protein